MKLNDFLLESGNGIIRSKRLELSLLIETLADDMKDIADNSVTKPFNQFKKDQLADFAKKLKAWAFSTLHEFSADSISYYSNQKHYIETLKKIVNNPQESAEQIFSAIINKQLNKDKDVKSSTVMAAVSL